MRLKSIFFFTFLPRHWQSHPPKESFGPSGEWRGYELTRLSFCYPFTFLGMAHETFRELVNVTLNPCLASSESGVRNNSIRTDSNTLTVFLAFSVLSCAFLVIIWACLMLWRTSRCARSKRFSATMHLLGDNLSHFGALENLPGCSDEAFWCYDAPFEVLAWTNLMLWRTLWGVRLKCFDAM